MSLKYKRVLLKLSGEALGGNNGKGFSLDVLNNIATTIKKCCDLGVEIGIVVGGGNFWRGRVGDFMNRNTADQIGMLATVMNSLAVSDALSNIGIATEVYTTFNVEGIGEKFCFKKVNECFKNNKVVIFGGGTGNPFFTTDTAASLKAAEICADVLLKATMVDGVYDSDPKKNENAKKYDNITFKDVMDKDLKVMDMTATAMCRENNIPVLVFDLGDCDNIIRAITGETIGTIVTN